MAATLGSLIWATTRPHTPPLPMGLEGCMVVKVGTNQSGVKPTSRGQWTLRGGGAARGGGSTLEGGDH